MCFIFFIPHNVIHKNLFCACGLFDTYYVITGASHAIEMGLKAITNLLKGTEQIKPTTNFRRFKKAGDYEKAKKDFYSVRPFNVHDFAFKNGVSFFIQLTFYFESHHKNMPI